MKEKRSLIPRGCTVPSLEMRRISYLLRLSLLPEMGPLVRNVPSYIKDTKHALQIFQNIHFSGTHKFIFTMDVKSLYTVIPHHDGLRALKFFLDKRPVQEPSTVYPRTVYLSIPRSETLNFKFPYN